MPQVHIRPVALNHANLVKKDLTNLAKENLVVSLAEEEDQPMVQGLKMNCTVWVSPIHNDVIRRLGIIFLPIESQYTRTYKHAYSFHLLANPDHYSKLKISTIIFINMAKYILM